MRGRESAVAAIVLIVAGWLRLGPALDQGFPLNDGGLFVTMAKEILVAGFTLPDSSSYNGLSMPFAYPPAGLYLLALLQSAGISEIDVLRWLPALTSISTVPLAFLIGREVFRNAPMAFGTAAFFAVSTGSFEWLIMGGGLTRAPGFLLALIAVLLATRCYARGSEWHAVGAGLAVGATSLWHPQAAVFCALSVALLVPFFATDRSRSVRLLGVILLVGAAVTAPWLYSVLSRHGIETLNSAASSGGTPFAGIVNLLMSHTSGGEIEVLGYATTLGLLVCALRHFWLPVVWLLAIVIVDSRAGQPYVALPAALAVTFMVRDLGFVVGRHLKSQEVVRDRRRIRSATASIGIVLATAAAGDSLAAQGDIFSPLRAVPEATRAAMAWVASETEPDATFVVVSGRYWAVDAESEWFPVLAERRSLATVQGYEWLGTDAFRRQRDRATELADCIAANDQACIEAWFSGAGQVDYLFLTDSPAAKRAGALCCLQLAEQMRETRRTEIVFSHENVIVVRLGAEDAG